MRTSENTSLPVYSPTSRYAIYCQVPASSSRNDENIAYFFFAVRILRDIILCLSFARSRFVRCCFPWFDQFLLLLLPKQCLASPVKWPRERVWGRRMIAAWDETADRLGKTMRLISVKNCLDAGRQPAILAYHAASWQPANEHFFINLFWTLR